MDRIAISASENNRRDFFKPLNLRGCNFFYLILPCLLQGGVIAVYRPFTGGFRMKVRISGDEFCLRDDHNSHPNASARFFILHFWKQKYFGMSDAKKKCGFQAQQSPVYSCLVIDTHITAILLLSRIYEINKDDNIHK